MLILVHAKCKRCGKICGCRVESVQQWCYRCDNVYCTLPTSKEEVLCHSCTNKKIVETSEFVPAVKE